MRQIIIKHIIQLNQENSLHQYKKRDTRILKSQRLKEVVEISQSMLKGDYEGLRKNRMICTDEMPEMPFHEAEYASAEWAQMLEPLDEKYRMIVLLYYMEGFNIREISDILDMKESTVKSRLQRGRKQIAQMYEYKVREGRV